VFVHGSRLSYILLAGNGAAPDHQVQRAIGVLHRRRHKTLQAESGPDVRSEAFRQVCAHGTRRISASSATLTKGWSLRHCRRSSWSRASAMPDMVNCRRESGSAIHPSAARGQNRPPCRLQNRTPARAHRVCAPPTAAVAAAAATAAAVAAAAVVFLVVVVVVLLLLLLSGVLRVVYFGGGVFAVRFKSPLFAPNFWGVKAVSPPKREATTQSGRRRRGRRWRTPTRTTQRTTQEDDDEGRAKRPVTRRRSID